MWTGLLVGLVLLAAPATALAVAAPAGPVPAPLAVPLLDPVVDSLTADATPRVSLAGAPIVLTGTVSGRNLPAAGLAVVVRRADTARPDRAAVAAWAAATGPATGGVLASGRATRSPAGGAAFRLSIAMTGLVGDQPYGVVPISIEAGGRSIHSFLPFHVRKEYEPLRVALAVPVVAAVDPRREGTAEERLAAWTAEADPGSRLRRLLDAVRGLRATLLVEPTLLDAGTVPEPATTTGTPTTTPSPNAVAEPAAYAASAEEVAARTRLADAVRAAAAAGNALRLPPSDPDVAAATAGGGALALVRERLGAGASGDTVLWPVDGSWSTPIEGTVDTLDPAHSSLAIADSSWLTATVGQSTQAAHTTRGGTPLLVADHALSDRLARTVDGSGVQAFLADTIALLAERPGTTRSYLVALPRAVAADPAWVSAAAAAQGTPWVEPVDVATLAADPAGAVVTPAATPPKVAASPLTRHGADLERRTRELVAASAVRVDADAYLARWTETSRALTATGWRRDPTGWAGLAEAVRSESDAVAAKLTVPAREINFLADSGRIRIVVANGLDVAVRGLRLRLIPESPRLRIDSDPIELEIGARSRTTVTVAATALAAGDVPLRAVLLTPTGEEISSSTNVRIRVTPTGAFVYWVIGGLAVLVLALGFLRSRRRRRAGAAPAGTLPA